MGDLRLDLPRAYRRETRGDITRAVAGLTLDSDALVIKVREVDRDIRPAVGARGHETPLHSEGAKGRGQNFRIGNVVVEHIGPFAAGGAHDRAVKISAVVVQRVIGAEGKRGAQMLVGAG